MIAYIGALVKFITTRPAMFIVPQIIHMVRSMCLQPTMEEHEEIFLEEVCFRIAFTHSSALGM